MAGIETKIERHTADATEEAPESSATGSQHTMPMDDLQTQLHRAPADSSLPPLEPDERYEKLGLIGTGGAGKVYRVFDRRLKRTLAMKVLRGPGAGGAGVARFTAEAQATAQLQHPAIVPIHDYGVDLQGNPWFTMKEVRGRTLADVMAEVHDASDHGRWREGKTGWTLRRLIVAVRRVCEGVAYAHARGVIHRDLKPSNVMVGEHGEVLVLDWGLAKVIGSPTPHEGVQTDRSNAGSFETSQGQVAGTPAYMPPEQAAGDVQSLDGRTDVYALGALLYHVLSGSPPYQSDSAQRTLLSILCGPPPALDGPRPLPAALVSACERAMTRDLDDRTQTAGELAAQIGAWLEGAELRDQARELTSTALARTPMVEALTAQAEVLEKRAEALLETVESWQPEDTKAPAWALQARAERLRREAAREDFRVEQGLAAALRIDSQLPEAHAALATRTLTAHRRAEAARNTGAAASAEALLGAHCEALPTDHPLRVQIDDYLAGDGSLTLITEPAGAKATLYRFVEHNRRLVPVLEADLGKTPVVNRRLSMGSYVVVLRLEGHADVRYPVWIDRGRVWSGCAPGERFARAISMPKRAELGPDDLYVPAGWFRFGGDPAATGGVAETSAWCDGFVMRRFPVTNREYLAFLNDLVDRGDEEEALRWVPRERMGHGVQGTMNYGRDARGHFILAPDEDGDEWLPDYPVVNISWGNGARYARWLRDQTGEAWRLPAELEWEKACRGVDARHYPMGNYLDGSWACTSSGQQGRPLPGVVDSFPVDSSVYGIRGLAGNVKAWCGDVFDPDIPRTEEQRVVLPEIPEDECANLGERRPLKGGVWDGDVNYGRSASRFGVVATGRSSFVGIRMVRSLD